MKQYLFFIGLCCSIGLYGQREKTKANNSIPVERLHELMQKQKDVLLIDCRPLAAQEIAHLQVAISMGPTIDVEQLWMRRRQAQVILYSQNRSELEEIQLILQEVGFEDIFFLDAPLKELSRKGFTVLGNPKKSDRWMVER